jgi:hypothetical protein
LYFFLTHTHAPDAGDWNLQTTVDMCLSAWMLNDDGKLFLKTQSSFESPSSLPRRSVQRQQRRQRSDMPLPTAGLPKKLTAELPKKPSAASAGNGALFSEASWEVAVSGDGETILRDRLRECKASESHLWILVGKAEACCCSWSDSGEHSEPFSKGPLQLGMLARILVVGNKNVTRPPCLHPPSLFLSLLPSLLPLSLSPSLPPSLPPSLLPALPPLRCVQCRWCLGFGVYVWWSSRSCPFPRPSLLPRLG